MPPPSSKVASLRAKYPHPLTADSSGDLYHFSSSQLAHVEERDAHKCEMVKDDGEIKKKEKKRDEDDDDFSLGSQELYTQSSSQSSNATDIATRVTARDEDQESEWEMDAEDTPHCSQSSQANRDTRTLEEILQVDKGISREKIKLIYKALHGHNFGVISPDRRSFAKKIVAILYQLQVEEVDTIDRWIRRNKGQLDSWPFEG